MAGLTNYKHRWVLVSDSQLKGTGVL